MSELANRLPGVEIEFSPSEPITGSLIKEKTVEKIIELCEGVTEIRGLIDRSMLAVDNEYCMNLAEDITAQVLQRNVEIAIIPPIAGG